MSKEIIEKSANEYAYPKIPQGSAIGHPALTGIYNAFINGAKCQEDISYSKDEVKPLLDFINDCSSNWDCDNDAHRYNTTCRMCEAKKILKQFKNKL